MTDQGLTTVASWLGGIGIICLAVALVTYVAAVTASRAADSRWTRYFYFDAARPKTRLLDLIEVSMKFVSKVALASLVVLLAAVLVTLGLTVIA